MAQNGIFQGDMDPEIAALLGAIPDASPSAASAMPAGDPFAVSAAEAPPPDYDSIFNVHSADEAAAIPADVDLATEHFPPVTKRFEPAPHAAFNDPNYYKTALANEGDSAQRVHTILQKYLNTKDPKDRSVFRQQFITAYWEFFSNVAKKAAGRLPEPKKYMLRFGILHPTFLDQQTRDLFATIVVENELNQPVYYLDEWFKNVGTGAVRNSSTDEVKVAKNNNNVKLQQLLEKAQGKLDGARSLLKAKDDERLNQERLLQDRVKTIMEHYPADGIPGVSSCYEETQKRAFAETQESLKNLIRIDHEMDMFMKDYRQAEADVLSLRDKIEAEGGQSTVDVNAVGSEIETIRQMTKMTIGRQGNHFPVLANEYFHCGPNDIGMRENIVAELSWIESIDPEAFCRTYKNRLNRIIPYVILIPSYGDMGICWEPFDRFNRATSRGRIAIPMYPKNLRLALLTAVGDLRWQVAKEKASFYWMEEGLTGNYYQWFNSQKLKGDLKEFFIQDYIYWMTKESEGTQKLHKVIRGVFWRFMPFSQEVKEKLKTRSTVYQELYQRDKNREMSDGY